jgi:hypothetical protein
MKTARRIDSDGLFDEATSSLGNEFIEQMFSS